MFSQSECLLALTSVLSSIPENSHSSTGNGMRLAASEVQFAVGKQIFIFSVLSKPPMLSMKPRVMGNWGRFLQGVK